MAKAEQKLEPQTFLDFLVAKGAIPKARAQRVQDESERVGRPPEALITEGGLLPEEEAYRYQSEFLGIPFRTIREDEKVPPELFRLVPEETAHRYQVVPLSRQDNTLDVGMVSPEEPSGRD